MTGAQRWEDLARGLAHMARDLLAQDSVQATLERIVDHAVHLVDGCEAAGIMNVRGDRVETLATSDDAVRASDRIQGELNEGPCFDADRHEDPVYRIEDMTTTVERWPRYADQARELGIGSMMGFLLYTYGNDDLGALDLYSSRPKAFTDSSEQVGWLLASHAAVALSSARHSANLQEALKTRQTIGEATGILMARYRLTEQEAFARIVTISQNNNVKVRDVADTINLTGDLPERS